MSVSEGVKATVDGLKADTHIQERGDLVPKSLLPNNYYDIMGLKPGSTTTQTIIWIETVPLPKK